MWGKAFPIGRVAGYEIRLDPSWFLIAGLFVWTLARAYFPQALPQAGTGTLVLLAIVTMLGFFGSLTLHELAHAVVARAYGMRVRAITLFLFGGVAELESEAPNPGAEYRVALAGPAASFALAIGFWLLSVALTPWPVIAVPLGYLGFANGVLAIFNLIPAFPLDGGRVLRAALWKRSGSFAEATGTASRVSALFAYGLIGLGLWTMFAVGPAAGLWPILLGLFLLAAATGARVQVETKAALSTLHVGDLMRRDPVIVHPDMTLDDVANDAMLRHAVSFVPVVEDGLLLGYLDLRAMQQIERENWGATRVDDIFAALDDDAVVGPDAEAQTLWERMQRLGRHKFLVVEGRRLLGVVTLSDIMARLRLARAIPMPHDRPG